MFISHDNVTNATNELSSSCWTMILYNPDYLMKPHTTVLTVITYLSCLIGSIGNLAVLTVIAMNEELHDYNNLLVGSLTLSDLICCSVLMALRIDFFQSTCTTAIKAYFITSFGYLASVGNLANLAAVTTERFIAIKLPFKYLAILRPPILVTAVSLLWLFTLTIAFGAEKYKALSSIHTFISYVFMIYIIALYCNIWIVARRQKRQINQQQEVMESTAGNMKKELKTTKTMAMFLGSFAACWLPFAFYMGLMGAYLSRKVSQEVFVTGFYYLSSVSTMNSVINSYIYSLRNKKIKRYIKHLFPRYLKNSDKNHSTTS